MNLALKKYLSTKKINVNRVVLILVWSMTNFFLWKIFEPIYIESEIERFVGHW
jgi:hypothetical protein